MNSARLRFAGLLAAALLGACSKPTASDRAVEFAALTFKGEDAELDDWFLPEARKSRFVKEFGGIDKLSQDSKAYADAQGGVASIEVVKADPEVNGVQVLRVQTTFKNGRAEISDQTWRQVDGEWKLAPPPDPFDAQEQ